MLQKSWFADKYSTFKTCASVFLIAAVVASSFLLIRLVGEKRLQSFLNMILPLRKKEPKLDLASKAFVPENKI